MIEPLKTCILKNAGATHLILTERWGTTNGENNNEVMQIKSWS